MDKQTNDGREKKKKLICILLESLCSAFSICGEDTVDWDEVERVDKILAEHNIK